MMPQTAFPLARDTFKTPLEMVCASPTGPFPHSPLISNHASFAMRQTGLFS